VLAAAVLAGAAACGRSSASESNPAIRLVTPPDGVFSYVEVTGLAGDALDQLDDRRYTAAEWSAMLRVAVSDEAPAVLGSYEVTGDAVRFTPAFPFDPGRRYHVTFDASRLPGGSSAEALVAEVGLPAANVEPSTVVARVLPSSEIVPENMLRMYIEFSAPMGRRGGIEHVQLVDDTGRVVQEPFLPFDQEFWSPDRRRFTVFFDPGRVKDGILPNREMGRALEAGRTYTLVVSREWQDDRGAPLREEYRRTLRIGPAQTEAIDPVAWTITAPRASTREPLVVSFRQPLDHGLLMRGLGVRADRAPVPGVAAVAKGETRWSFTPDTPWRARRYELLALSILEDPAGNQIGRAFEIENTETVDRGPEAQDAVVPFLVRSASTE
jgi:hypothetical protein